MCQRAVSFRRIWIIILAGMILQACSSQFIYDRIDRIAQFYIERYIGLDKDQSSLLKVNLASLKEWHRQEELKGYQQFLNEIESDLQGHVSAETVAGWVQRLRQAYNQVRDRALPPMIEMAQTLSDAQVQELAANMEKRNSKLEKEYLARDDSEYRESAYDEMDDRLREWLGRLTPEQKQRLHAAVSRLERLDQAWLDGRRSWQKQIIGELQRKPGWQSRLTALVIKGNEYSNEQDVAASHRNEQHVYEAVADVLNMRNGSQRIKLQEKLDNWKKDLAELQNYRQKSG